MSVNPLTLLTSPIISPPVSRSSPAASGDTKNNVAEGS